VLPWQQWRRWLHRSPLFSAGSGRRRPVHWGRKEIERRGDDQLHEDDQQS